MKSEKFFGGIQKINSVLMLLCGIGVLFVLGLLIWEQVGRAFRTKAQPALVEIGGVELDHSRFSVGRFDRLVGTDIMMAPLLSMRDFPRGFSSGGGRHLTSNLLLFDLRTSKSTWLLDNHDSILPWYRIATSETPDGEGKTAIALLFHVVSDDTNGDGSLTFDDHGAIGISKPDGSGRNELVTNVDDALEFEQISGAEGVLLYVSSGSLRVARFNLQSRDLERDLDLSMIPDLDQSLVSDGG